MSPTEIKQQFVEAGFTACPLSDEEITACIAAKADTFGVGCDVHAGFTFEEALTANVLFDSESPIP